MSYMMSLVMGGPQPGRISRLRPSMGVPLSGRAAMMRLRQKFLDQPLPPDFRRLFENVHGRLTAGSKEFRYIASSSIHDRPSESKNRLFRFSWRFEGRMTMSQPSS